MLTFWTNPKWQASVTASKLETRHGWQSVYDWMHARGIGLRLSKTAQLLQPVNITSHPDRISTNQRDKHRNTTRWDCKSHVSWCNVPKQKKKRVSSIYIHKGESDLEVFEQTKINMEKHETTIAIGYNGLLFFGNSYWRTPWNTQKYTWCYIIYSRLARRIIKVSSHDTLPAILRELLLRTLQVHSWTGIVAWRLGR